MADTAQPAEDPAPEQAPRSSTAIFRIPGISVLAVALLTVCILPIAFGEIPGLQVLLLIPLALLVFVLRTRTVANAEGLRVRTLFGGTELAWTELKGLALSGKARVYAVRQDDSRVRLPTVRARHLPVLSLVSQGRLPDPSGVLDQPEETGGSETEAPALSDADSAPVKEEAPAKDEKAETEQARSARLGGASAEE